MNPIYLLAWIPETLLNEKGSSEWDKFVKVEEQPNTPEEDDDGASWLLDIKSLNTTYSWACLQDIILIELPTQRPESYAFSVPITSIYSLIVNPPSLSSWCAWLLFPNTLYSI